MYNQVNHGPHSGQGPHAPMQPAYQRVPPPPPHFQQGPPGPPAPNVYPHGPPATSSAVPHSVMQNTGQSYVIPSLLHGNSMVPQRFSSLGPNIQHSSNLGFQTHHISPPVPPPLYSQSHQETSWAPGPPSRVLPPPPPPPFHPCPPQPGDLQSLQHSQNPPPPPPPSVSGFAAPTSDGGYLHSTVGSCQMPSSITPPPLPSSPPPIPPSPPPLAPPVTSQSSHAVHSDPNSNKVSGFELEAVTSDLNQDGESYTKVVIADRDELLSTKNVVLDLPPPPHGPSDVKTVQKIEALCHLISENGPAFEDKVRQNESLNSEYAFLFGGDPGTEAAISHAYFLWMKKKYNLEHRWNDKKSDSQLRPLAVESSGKQYDMHVATEGADSDMEMEG